MKLTESQFDALLPYRKHFETMVKSNWARHPGSEGLDIINNVYQEVSGVKQKMNKGCSACIMRLLKDMGVIFLADLEERERKVEVSQVDVEPVKTEVKTKRGGRRTKRQNNGNEKNQDQ